MGPSANLQWGVLQPHDYDHHGYEEVPGSPSSMPVGLKPVPFPREASADAKVEMEMGGLDWDSRT